MPSRTRPALLGFAGFLVFAIPCWIYIHATWGQWLLSPKVSAIRAPYLPGQDEAIGFGGGAAAPEVEVGAARVLRHLPDALASYPANAWIHGRALFHLWPWGWMLLSLWGLVRRRGIESVPLLHLLVLPLMGLSGQVRFLLAAIPALAMSATAAPWSTSRPFRALAALLLALGLVLHAGGFRTQLTQPFEGDWEAQRRAGLWLGSASRPGERVMDRKPYLAFYAHRPYWRIPLGSVGDVVAAARRDSVRWLVVDEGVARVLRPQLLPLLFDPAFRDREDRLEAAYVGGLYEGHTVAVFRVLGPGEARSGRPPRVALEWAKEGLDRLHH
jgi:hypothetical protein